MHIQNIQLAGELAKQFAVSERELAAVEDVGFGLVTFEKGELVSLSPVSPHTATAIRQLLLADLTERNDNLAAQLEMLGVVGVDEATACGCERPAVAMAA